MPRADPRASLSGGAPRPGGAALAARPAGLIGSILAFGDVALLAGRAVLAAPGAVRDTRTLFGQMFALGVMSLPVILATGAFMGLVLAVQTFVTFQNLGVESLTGAVVSLSVTRELGPVLTALMLASRVGASMSAEIATMKVTEQIDALRAMGTDPVEHLATPRLLSLLALAPVLTIFAEGVAIVAGYVISVGPLRIDGYYFIKHARYYVVDWDILSGLIKAMVFGGLIAVISCHKGFTAEEGAVGVGRATTRATVTSCIAVLVADFFLAVLLHMVV
jgi:phospholipid/cholesterol/gamma-HCH transport system permease protein